MRTHSRVYPMVEGRILLTVLLDVQTPLVVSLSREAPRRHKLHDGADGCLKQLDRGFSANHHLPFVRTCGRTSSHRHLHTEHAGSDMRRPQPPPRVSAIIFPSEVPGERPMPPSRTALQGSRRATTDRLLLVALR